jgi:hypothetical protein
MMEPMETMEASERKPIEARCKSPPDREAARPDEPTAEAGTAKAPAAKASSHRRSVEATAVEAATVEAASTHPGIRCRRRRYRACEGDGGQRNLDVTHHRVSSICCERWGITTSSADRVEILNLRMS